MLNQIIQEDYNTFFIYYYYKTSPSGREYYVNQCLEG